MVNRTLIFFTLLLVLISTVVSHAAELSVRTSRTQIGINESVSLQLTAVGRLDDAPDLSVLEKDFELVDQAQESQVSIINGDYSKSKIWSLTLLPKRSGILTIPALCSGSDCSKPTTVIVRKSSINEQVEAKVILEAEVSSHDVMVQQQLIYTVRLWVRQPLLQAGLGEVTPEGVETTVVQLGDDVRYEAERGSYRYQVIERKFALFPQQVGQLHLPSLHFNGQVQDSNQSRMNSRFDPFRQGGKIIRLRTKAIDVTVHETPPLTAQQAWLPATKFLIGDDWQQTPPTLTVGEPATRTIITSVTGIPAAQLPELTITSPDSFKSYPDQTMRQDQLEPTGVRGMMEQKVAVVPTRAGSFTLPAIQLKWWDIASKKWRTQSTKPITVQVLPAQRDASMPTKVSAAAQPAPAAPSATVVTPTPPTQEKAPSAFREFLTPSIWLWTSIVCASGWAITLLLLWRSRKQKTAPLASKNIVTPTPLSADKALAEVIRCARNHEASQTRTALQGWVATIEPQSDLELFTQQAGEPLKTQIAVLNQTLYSATADKTWRGDELASALETWSSQPSVKEKTDLPDFYPKN